MKWSYILFLPAIVSIAWALIIILTKKRPTQAQVLFTLSLIFEAFAITVAGIYFRGHVERLFIYDFLLEVTVVFCFPLYYISICSLTEPRGANLKQRHVFLIPILFTIGLVIGAFGMHPSRYQAMCLDVAENGRIPWHPDDMAYNFMILWNQIVFPLLMLVMGTVLLLMSERKVRRYKQRFDSYYAQGLNMPRLNIREIVIITWLFLPFIMLTIYLIAYRPFYYKYWLILCALMLTVIQYMTGRFAYRYNYDARFLADYIRNKEQEEKKLNS
jgi:hypothetical protein